MIPSNPMLWSLYGALLLLVVFGVAMMVQGRRQSRKLQSCAECVTTAQCSIWRRVSRVLLADLDAERLNAETRKAEQMKINLHELAVTMAKMDNPKARNEDVIAAETQVGNLGRHLRSLDAPTAIATVAAILERAGKKSGQALVEYALILSLIAVVSIAVLTGIGKNVNAKLAVVNEALER